MYVKCEYAPSPFFSKCSVLEGKRFVSSQRLCGNVNETSIVFYFFGAEEGF